MEGDGMKSPSRRIIAWAGVLLLAAQLARAEAVNNGNELALHYTRGTAAAKAQLRKDSAGVYHGFRYLKVVAMATDTNEVQTPILTTIEPSSDMQVVLYVSGKLSYELVATLSTGECVAVRGRVKSLGVENPNLMVVSPAILLHKDRATPKAGKELMPEVDRRAAGE